MSSLSKKIITTIAYYDVLDYPMTSFEIWKHMMNSEGERSEDVQTDEVRLSDVIKELDGDVLRKRVQEHLGYYVLSGRQALVGKRIARNKISQHKMKIIRRVVRWLRFLPYVRMAAVTGTVAQKNADGGSDLDLLIVIRHGRIFIGRTIVTFFIHIIGKRRHGKKITNRVCLNCFLTDRSLEIGLKDVFSASEYSFMLPLFGWKTYEEFVSANEWIQEFKNCMPARLPNYHTMADSTFSRTVRGVLEWFLNIKIFDFLEKKLEKWQIDRIVRDPRTHLDGSIIIADNESLVFFPEPQSPKVYDKFKKRLEMIRNCGT